MAEKRTVLQKISEEFLKFQMTMEEIHFLKLVAEDLRSFKKMIRLKRYD